MKKQTLVGNIITYIIVGFVAVIALFPIIYTVASSFKTNAEILAFPERIFPRNPSFENYITAWNSEDFNIKQMFWNSTYYTVICVFVTLLSSTMAGYVFTRGEFPGKKLIFAVFSATMFISLGTITVYPLFDILTAINLNRSLWGLILVKIFSISIVNIYLSRSFIKTIPTALDEAAIIDGCSFISIFFRIILPMIKPITATIGILAFQSSWNEYLMPSIFTTSVPSQRTLIVGVVALKNSGDGAASWNLMLAGSTVALIPVLIAYAIGNKYFVSGMTAGAVKG
ncbi:MAG: carbohydrate ABC transporter permease [Clostridia bacterium]|nr:carbohydrate ABC transporter permease [Clostridia bacterium]